MKALFEPLNKPAINCQSPNWHIPLQTLRYASCLPAWWRKLVARLVQTYNHSTGSWEGRERQKVSDPIHRIQLLVPFSFWETDNWRQYSPAEKHNSAPRIRPWFGWAWDSHKDKAVVCHYNLGQADRHCSLAQSKITNGIIPWLKDG